jgi:hypothetical protein
MQQFCFLALSTIILPSGRETSRLLFISFTRSLPFAFRTVRRYGKIWYQKPTKCISNSSTFNIIMFRQPWTFAMNYRDRGVLCTSRHCVCLIESTGKAFDKKCYFDYRQSWFSFVSIILFDRFPPCRLRSIIQWYIRTPSRSYERAREDIERQREWKFVWFSCHNSFSSRH